MNKMEKVYGIEYNNGKQWKCLYVGLALYLTKSLREAEEYANRLTSATDFEHRVYEVKK